MLLVGSIRIPARTPPFFVASGLGPMARLNAGLVAWVGTTVFWLPRFYKKEP